MPRLDTRPVALVPERGSWILMRWREYNGHFATLAKSEAGIVSVYKRRCQGERQLLEIVDLVHIEIGNPRRPVLARMARSRYNELLVDFKHWVMDTVGRLQQEGDPLPAGFETCTERVLEEVDAGTVELLEQEGDPLPEGYERNPEGVFQVDDRHYSCRKCRGRQIVAHVNWRELFERAGAHWWASISHRHGKAWGFKPYDVQQVPLTGPVEYASKEHYGIDFTPVPENLEEMRGIQVLFFFVRKGEAKLPRLDEYIKVWMSDKSDKQKANREIHAAKLAARKARELAEARAIMAVVLGTG